MIKILIVDDNAENLDGLRKILEVHGYSVMTASNGSEALEIAGNTLPDLIITDVLMPVMDGFTLCKNWKRDEVFKTIPLIFYSGDYIDPKDEKFGLSLGAERFIIKPADPGVFMQIIQEIIEEYHNKHVAIPHENKRGEELYLKEYSEALIRRLEDKMLEIERVNRLLEDRITEYERVSEALRESEEKYRALFEQSPYSIILVDGETAELAEFNTRAHENLGYTMEEFEKLKIHDFEVMESEEEVQRHLKKVMKNGYDVFETKHRRKDGEVRNVLVHSSAVIIGGRSFSQSVSTDITERKRAEEAMRHIAEGVSATVGEEYFYSLVKHLSAMLKSDYAYVAEVDKDNPGRVRTLALIGDGKFVDNLEVELAGTPCDTVSRKVVASYPSGVQKLFPEAQIMAAMNVEGYIGTRLTDSSGNWLGLITVMYREPVKNVEMVESILKIFASRAAAEIERRRSEEALRRAKAEIEKWNKTLEQRVKEKTEELIKSQAQLIQSEKLAVMGQMAAGLAHELNSPLAGLLPLIEKHKEKTDKGSRDYKELSMMLKASRHMAKVVRDFGTFSREPKGELREINLNEVIDDTLVFSGVNLKKKRIEIEKNYNEDLPKVIGDKTELQQVVLNMLTNAGDAMRDGGQLTIKTRASQDNKKIMMEFTDCGSGIKKEYLDKIFEPFFTTKKMGEGTGLGLSVSYGIISNHGGEISVESESGKGAKFTISLPAVDAE